jgi:hypothetical protein
MNQLAHVMQTPGQLNLLAAWVGILLGFLMGFVFGLFFHRDDWLGGYGSFRRRLYRLAHIALFALAAINFCFYLTVRGMENTWPISVASIGFVVGAGLMPICCVLMAHWPRTRYLFGAPVLSLLVAATLTIQVLATSNPATSDTPARGWAVH